MAQLSVYSRYTKFCVSSLKSSLVYARSSSVYGLNTSMQLSEKQPTQHPISLYSATKKANEMMAHTYSHLFRIPKTGLRFFTVYGPWVRPDMALFLFADSIMKDLPIKVFNHGNMIRDFTYVGDIVESIKRLVVKPVTENIHWNSDFPDSDSEEVLDAFKFRKLGEASALTQAWLWIYNNERPHESLGYKSPVDFAQERLRSKAPQTLLCDSKFNWKSLF